MSEKNEKLQLIITSSAFKSKGNIPLKYAYNAAGGENKSIPVSWTGAPEGTKSFVLLIYDIHPVAHDWVHWLVTDISTDVNGIEDGASGTVKMPAGVKELKNTSGELGYDGPCPPVGSGKHEYKVILYAMNTEHFEVKEPISYAAIKKALEGNVLEMAEIQGFYER